jgi:hypothetical protein
MSSVAIILTAGSLALTPPVDLNLTPGSLAMTPSAFAQVEGVCGPQFDPQFVRFVPEAPPQAGNSLFRLISNPEHRASPTRAGIRHPGDLAGCGQMLLTRFAPRP